MILVSLKYISLLFSLIFSNLSGQTINRYGTTAANFLEIGVGSRATSMGDAYVAVANDVSSIYWNPAGLASCLLYTSPSPRDGLLSRMPSSA